MMIATLQTHSTNKQPNYRYTSDNENHANCIDLDINEKGQITLPKWLLEQWNIQSGSKITLTTQIDDEQPSKNTQQFDESRQLIVSELIKSVGVHTNKKASVKEMNASIAQCFKNWEME